MVQVCLVGHDNQPTTAFRMLIPELMEKGVASIYANLANGGKNNFPLCAKTIIGSKFLLLGMSSSPAFAQMEIAAAKVALENKVPYGFYSDIFRCHRRGWYRPYSEGASLVFAFNASEIDDTRNYFPNAQVVHAGNPTHREYFKREYTREKVREIIGFFGQDDFVIFVGLVKRLDLNLELIDLLPILLESGAKVVFGLHPSDKIDINVYNTRAESLANNDGRYAFVKRDVLSGSQAICGADLYVESSGSLSIEAACKRVPVVTYLTERNLDLLEMESGVREWAPNTMGLTVGFQTGEQLFRILRERSYMGVVEKAKEIYPESYAEHDALGIMRDTVRSMVLC